MADVVRGYNATVVSGGVGTVVLTNGPTNLVRIVVPGTYVGSITFHNAPSAAGTSTTTPILTLGLPVTALANSIEVGANCGRGLVYEATGTPLMTVIWG